MYLWCGVSMDNHRSMLVKSDGRRIQAEAARTWWQAAKTLEHGHGLRGGSYGFSVCCRSIGLTCRLARSMGSVCSIFYHVHFSRRRSR